MSVPERPSAEAFAVGLLRDDPNLDYGTVRARAEEAGVSLHPIHYGRARKQLGLPALREARAEAPVRPAASATASTPRAEPGDEPEHDADRLADSAAPADEPEDEPPAEPTEPAGAAAPVAPAAPAAARKKGSLAFDFLVQELRREPAALYATLRQRAEQRGFKIAPIMYGRAKAVLGLVPVKPRGSKRDADERGRAKAAAGSLPLQLRQVESVAADRFAKKLDEVRNLEQLVAIVRDLDAERRRLRDVLERVITMLDEALG